MSGRRKDAELVDLTHEDAQIAAEIVGEINHRRVRDNVNQDDPVMIVIDDSLVDLVVNAGLRQHPHNHIPHAHRPRQPELIDVSDDDSDPNRVNDNNNITYRSNNNNNHNNIHHHGNPSSSNPNIRLAHQEATDHSSTTTPTNESKRKQSCRTPTNSHCCEAKKRLRSSSAESPDNSLKCPICIESYNTIKARGIKVVVTRCGHLFCDSCLKKAFTENGRKCPKCRKTIPKSATSVIEIYDVC